MDTQDDEEFTPFIPALWINEMDRTQAERVISNLYEVDSDVGRRQVTADVRLPHLERATSVGMALLRYSESAEVMDERRLKRETERAVHRMRGLAKKRYQWYLLIVTREELKALRATLGFTQEELAERVGVARNTINRWEMGIRRIPEPVARLVHYLAKEVRAERMKKRS